jgi:hypothetical protein
MVDWSMSQPMSNAGCNRHRRRHRRIIDTAGGVSADWLRSPCRSVPDPRASQHRHIEAYRRSAQCRLPGPFAFVLA